MDVNFGGIVHAVATKDIYSDVLFGDNEAVDQTTVPLLYEDLPMANLSFGLKRMQI